MLNPYLEAHIAPGVLFCHLPAATHPGVVKVTLCQTSAIDGEPYGRSLASFEYESDSTKAFVKFLSTSFHPELSFTSVFILLKILNGRLLMEAAPLIQRLLQQIAVLSGVGVQGDPADSNTVLPSSLSESAFINILSALEPLLISTIALQ